MDGKLSIRDIIEIRLALENIKDSPSIEQSKSNLDNIIFQFTQSLNPSTEGNA